jgi:predicted nucleic acid-binding Zn ribbon protein
VKPVRTSVEALRRQMGLGAASSLETIAADWVDLAGAEVAAASDVIDLRGGTLTVNAYDPGAAEVLNWSKQRILAGIATACPDERVTAISVRVRRRPRAT